MVRRNYQCSQCEYKATQICHLRQHIDSNHEDKKVFCQLCGNKFCSEGNLQAHIKSVHVGQKFPCQKLQQDLKTENHSDDLVMQEYFERDVKFEVDSTIKVDRSTKLKLESLSVNNDELEEYFEKEVKSEIDSDNDSDNDPF